MSSAVMERTAVRERIIDQPQIHEWIAGKYAPDELKLNEPAKKLADPHPLVPVLIAGVLSLTLAVMFVGSILAWIALRHSGVMAP